MGRHRLVCAARRLGVDCRPRGALGDVPGRHDQDDHAGPPGATVSARLAADGAAMAASSSMSESFVHLTAAGGMPRMWRGVQTMFTGCVPAHAAYFSIYEGCKARFSPESSPAAGADAATGAAASTATAGGASASGSGAGTAVAAGAAVALATMAHDVIMTPMDCIKQRLQLGHHKNSLVDCACAMLQDEGPRAFLRSYPTTLMMNVPYALVMGTANEGIRNVLNPNGQHSLATYLVVRARTHPATSPSPSTHTTTTHTHAPLPFLRRRARARA